MDSMVRLLRVRCGVRFGVRRGVRRGVLALLHHLLILGFAGRKYYVYMSEGHYIVVSKPYKKQGLARSQN